MKIKFCGAAREVTGSAHLITLDDGFQILLDCGLCQGGKDSWEKNNQWYFKPEDIDCLILSHAHIDHCGRIPKVVKDGFKGPIYATHATRSLCAIMLLDSAKIQERDAEYYNHKILKKKKKKNKDKNKQYTLREPLYTSKIIPEVMSRYIGHSYNFWFNIHKDVQVCYKDSGHILGSASVTLRITEGDKVTTFGFTGDIGREDRPILRNPQLMPAADYLICESTYGDKEHELPPQQSDKFLDVLHQTCVKNRGKLIIPAFSVGRTQEIVYMMDQLYNAGKLPKIPVYVDSPLAVNATQVFGAHPECYDEDLSEYLLVDKDPFGFNSLTYISSVDESKALNHSKEPAVIISASGMMNAGRIRHHMYNGLENEKNTFLIVGYCAPNTAGGILRAGVKELKIFGDMLQVKANIEIMESFSAHADRQEMLHFIKNHRPNLQKLFLVHGDYDTQLKFKPYLHDAGFKDVEIPSMGQEFQIN